MTCEQIVDAPGVQANPSFLEQTATAIASFEAWEAAADAVVTPGVQRAPNEVSRLRAPFDAFLEDTSRWPAAMSASEARVLLRLAVLTIDRDVDGTLNPGDGYAGLMGRACVGALQVLGDAGDVSPASIETGAHQGSVSEIMARFPVAHRQAQGDEFAPANSAFDECTGMVERMLSLHPKTLPEAFAVLAAAVGDLLVSEQIPGELHGSPAKPALLGVLRLLGEACGMKVDDVFGDWFGALDAPSVAEGEA